MRSFGTVPYLFEGAALTSAQGAEEPWPHVEKVGRGWLLIHDGELSLWDLNQPGAPARVFTAGEVVGVERVRVWRAVLTSPLIRIRFSDGRAFEATLALPGFRGQFGFGNRRMEQVGNEIESLMRSAPAL
ncbi:hypothetical protein [Microbacterium sp. cx-59]|uniref:hypothetical protein n=1 Tax=Microbacterium sp. cx-59 TaxID=2891207 RepID=UPI001E361B58|nr:hypothetical protein [Microbacterium sp. cx-59]MCC4908811.1 hypothetical protein [Microbacterium sp. cx-59]